MARTRLGADHTAMVILQCIQRDPANCLIRLRPLFESGYYDYDAHEIMKSVCGKEDLHHAQHGRILVFEVGALLKVEPAKVVGYLAGNAFLRTQNKETIKDGPGARYLGQDILNWLIDDHQLATRQDLGEDQNLRVLELLIDTLKQDHLSYIDQNWTRQWAGMFIDELRIEGVDLDPASTGVDLLRREARAHATNVRRNGLFLALLDKGATWEGVMADTDINPQTKSMVQEHPLFVRAALEQVADGQTSERARPRRGM